MYGCCGFSRPGKRLLRLLASAAGFATLATVGPAGLAKDRLFSIQRTCSRLLKAAARAASASSACQQDGKHLLRLLTELWQDGKHLLRLLTELWQDLLTYGFSASSRLAYGC